MPVGQWKVMHQKRTLLKALTYMWKLHSCSHRSTGWKSYEQRLGSAGQ